MHVFASRYSPVVVSDPLSQLHNYAQGEAFRATENQPQLDEFYIAVNELLLAVFHFAEKLKLDYEGMLEEES